MNQKQRTLFSLGANALTFTLSLTGILYYYISQLVVLMEVDRKVLNLYFTVNSNIFLAVVSVIGCALYALAHFKKRELPKWFSILRLTAVTAVSLTFFTTVFFLAPVFGSQDKDLMISLFTGCNLFMHILSPVVAMIGFCLFETHNEIKFKHVAIAIIPIVLYQILYMSLVFGTGDTVYDLYGFVHTIWEDYIHIPNAIITIIGTPIISFGLATLWWYLNRLSSKKAKNE